MDLLRRGRPPSKENQLFSGKVGWPRNLIISPTFHGHFGILCRSFQRLRQPNLDLPDLPWLREAKGTLLHVGMPWYAYGSTQTMDGSALNTPISM